MKTLKFPLVGSYNNRSFAAVSGKDQFFKGCVITRAVNKALNAATYYVEKRPGLDPQATPASGKTAYGLYASPSTLSFYTVFSNASSGADLYSGTTNCGTIATSLSAPPYLAFTETIISGITYILITSRTTVSNGVGWFLASDATTGGLSQTGTTHSNTTVDGIASTTGYYAGQAYSGSGIAANTRIASVDSANQITLTLAASTSTTASFTREAVAKIIDADFPTDVVGGFAELDGWVTVMTYSGRVYNSDLNSVISWNAANYLTCSKYADNGRGVIRYRSRIIAFGTNSIEFLYNAGNASGSPFSSADEAIGSAAMSVHDFNCVANAEGSVYWLACDGNVYTMEGYSPKRISASGIAPDLVNTKVTPFFLDKKSYLNLNYSSSSYWYCITDDIWLESAFGNIAYAASVGGVVGTFFLLGGSDTTGKRYGMFTGSSAVYQDNGSAFTMSIQVATDAGTNKRKFVSELRIEADVQASGTLDVSYSDDDGASFSTAQSISLTSTRMRLTGTLGSFEGTRLWKFEHSANTPFRAKSIEIDYEVAA